MITKQERSIDRLRKFILYLKQNKMITGDSQFEKACGLSNKYVANTATKGRPGTMGTDIISRIHSKYPELNITWLCTGDGDMLESAWVPENEMSGEIEKAEKLANELKRTIARMKRAKF